MIKTVLKICTKSKVFALGMAVIAILFSTSREELETKKTTANGGTALLICGILQVYCEGKLFQLLPFHNL